MYSTGIITSEFVLKLKVIIVFFAKKFNFKSVKHLLYLIKQFMN